MAPRSQTFGSIYDGSNEYGSIVKALKGKVFHMKIHLFQLGKHFRENLLSETLHIIIFADIISDGV